MVIGTGWCDSGIRLLVVTAAEDRITWREIMLVRCTAVLGGSGDLVCGGGKVVADRCSCLVLASSLAAAFSSSFSAFSSFSDSGFGGAFDAEAGGRVVVGVVVVVVVGRHDEVVGRWMIGFSN